MRPRLESAGTSSTPEPPAPRFDRDTLELLRCPVTGEGLEWHDGALVTRTGTRRYLVNESGIPLFADVCCSEEGRSQQRHYDRIASAYLKNLTYPHTQEYVNYLDRVFLEEVGVGDLGVVAELCCGRGEAFHLLRDRVRAGIGVDVSVSMLEAARRELPGGNLTFVQGDATRLPLAGGRFDHVVMLGGIHHVNDRAGLFSEVGRILKPGGRFIWREPVSDFVVWRALRAVVYRVSPTLDHRTERPLLWRETVPPLERAGFRVKTWRTCGFVGFCLLMNSDVLVVNRLLRFLPGIRTLTRAMASLDERALKLAGLARAGLIVVGVAESAA